MALGDPPGQTDVPSRAVVVAVGGRRARRRPQAVDPLLGDAHTAARSPADKSVACRRAGGETGSVKSVPSDRPAVRVLNHLELASRLDRSGIGTAAAHQRAALADTRVEVVTSPWRGDGPLAAARAGLDGDGLLREVDVAHCNLPGPATLGIAAAARRSDTPLVLHAHVTAEDFRGSFRGSDRVAPALRRYLRRAYSLADLVLCPSEHTRRTLAAYPVRAPVRAVTNGIDRESLAGFERLREPYRERFGLDGLVVFAVGNVFERKGVDVFCRLAEATDHEFAWFGPYDTGPQASATVRRLTGDPPANVTFTGWIDDKRGAFAAGDVYCFPTRAENQGIAVLEAMACGKPVVLRDLPVFREYYTDGEDCLLCETEAEFRAALDRLAADPDLRERLGAAARETAREHGLDRVGERLVAAYEEVTSH